MKWKKRHFGLSVWLCMFILHHKGPVCTLNTVAQTVNMALITFVFFLKLQFLTVGPFVCMRPQWCRTYIFFSFGIFVCCCSSDVTAATGSRKLAMLILTNRCPSTMHTGPFNNCASLHVSHFSMYFFFSVQRQNLQRNVFLNERFRLHVGGGNHL